jgi:hypothetical protein
MLVFSLSAALFLPALCKRYFGSLVKNATGRPTFPIFLFPFSFHQGSMPVKEIPLLG